MYSCRVLEGNTAAAAPLHLQVERIGSETYLTLFVFCTCPTFPLDANCAKTNPIK